MTRTPARFRLLLPALDLGAYPQCQSWEPTYDHRADDSVYRLNLHNTLPPRIALDGMILAPGAPATDFLSTAFTNPGLVVTSRARKVLSTLSLGVHRFYPATVIAGNAARLPYELLVVRSTPWAELGFVSATLAGILDPAAPVRRVEDLASFERIVAGSEWRPLELELEGAGAALDVLRAPGPFRPFGSVACLEAIARASLTGLARG